MDFTKPYILRFATIICICCGVIVAVAAEGLRERQEVNKQLDRQKKVLTVMGLMEEGERLPRDEVQRRFDTAVRPVVIELATGGPAPDELDPIEYDQGEATRDPDRSSVAPANRAKVARVPKYGTVYQRVDGDAVQMVVIPVEGKGLWSTLYGYLAVDNDGNTVRGITFYQHGETPGLGGEVDNPRWKASWPGRRLFDSDGEPAIRVIKGSAGTAEENPHKIDGLSGATITANGVEHLVRFWTGEHGFGPYLAQLRSEGGDQ